MKYIPLCLIMCIYPYVGYAGGSHHDDVTVNVESSILVLENKTEVTQHITINKKVIGMALGIAKAQHQFDKGSPKLQWSIGAGSFEDSDAISLGLGKRINGVMVNGSYGIEDGEEGYGIGINGNF